jgi:hypothetical protein
VRRRSLPPPSAYIRDPRALAGRSRVSLRLAPIGMANASLPVVADAPMTTGRRV